MQNIRIIARIVGPVMLASSIGMFLNLHTYKGMVEEFAKSQGLCYLGGFTALIMGLVILQFHHQWEAGWPVLITILGWIATLKGALLMLFPGMMLSVWHPLTATSTPWLISASISLIIGAFLTWKGYDTSEEAVA